ncbi:MAG: succinate dehydrogenase/fumarate reductase flavoprotein subunit, partial [Lautropia sp.]
AALKAGIDYREPDEGAIHGSIAAHELPFRNGAGARHDLGLIRESLYEVMWSDVGILRTAQGLERALGRLALLDAQLSECAVADDDRAFNLSWHDWINLRSLIAVSRAIATAALARDDSRGAHFREDFPDTSELQQSTFTVVTELEGGLRLRREAVAFTRVQPGETLIATGTDR